MNRATFCRLMMQDNNLRYTDDICDYVRDSCLVLQNTRDKHYYLFGMDYCADYVGYTMTAFQTFAALCGTDFTDAMFTPTMAREVLTATRDQMEFINNQGNDIVRLTAAMLLVAIRNGATLSRSSVCNLQKVIDCPAELYRVLTDNTEQYIKYIRTGVMDGHSMVHINMNQALRTMIADIYQQTGENCIRMARMAKRKRFDLDDKKIVNWIKKQRNLYALIEKMTPASTLESVNSTAATTTVEAKHNLDLSF